MSTPFDIAGFDEASSSSPIAGPGNLASSAPPAIASEQTVGVRRRRGRHHGPRPVPDPRSAWLTTRTTHAFLAKVRADARATDMSVSDYMHIALWGRPSPRARRAPTEATKLLAQILGQMGKRGSNLNQAARALNEINLVARDGEGRDRLAHHIDEMMALHQQALAEHRECVATIMWALGLRPDADHY